MAINKGIVCCHRFVLLNLNTIRTFRTEVIMMRWHKFDNHVVSLLCTLVTTSYHVVSLLWALFIMSYHIAPLLWALVITFYHGFSLLRALVIISYHVVLILLCLTLLLALLYVLSCTTTDHSPIFVLFILFVTF